MPTKKSLKKSAASTKEPIKKTIATKARIVDGPRLRKLSRKQKRKKDAQKLKVQQKQKKLPAAWVLLAHSLRHLYRYKKTFLGILLVYAFFYILFIKGISANFQLGNLRHNLNATFNGNLSSLDAGFALYGLLLGTAGNNGTSETAGVYQTVILILTSLALIWALRSSYAGKAKIRVKESFYRSTQSLVPFLAISLVLMLQCLPAIIVGSLYSTVKTNGLAVDVFQQGIALAILALGMFWTFYMLSSSLFALYIVTLPDAKPWASLKAAKKLVKFRRIAILRKVLFLPIVLLLFSAIVLIPLIIFIPKAAEILFLIFTISVLGVVHSYLYNLYRNLINE